MEKYYTPEIEEFYVGFEFEVLCDRTKSWLKEEFINDVSEYPSMDQTGWYHHLIEDSKLRVKYLDKEDIESLGFVDASLSTTSHTTNIYIIPRKVAIHHIPHLQKVQITVDDRLRTPHPNRGFKEKVIFQGIIRNKSELKVLLKQLNIV